MSLAEAGVRPEDEMRHPRRPAPAEDQLAQGPPGALSAHVGVEIPPMKFRAVGVDSFHADRPRDDLALAENEEAPPRGLVVALEVEQIRHFRGRIVEEAVL